MRSWCCVTADGSVPSQVLVPARFRIDGMAKFAAPGRACQRGVGVQIWLVAVLHIDKVVLQSLAECVEPGGKVKGLMASMVNATKMAEKRQAKRGLTTDGCMQLSAEVGHLVRLLAQAQPDGTSAVDVLSLMTVPHWAEVRLPPQPTRTTQPLSKEPLCRALHTCRAHLGDSVPTVPVLEGSQQLLSACRLAQTVSTVSSIATKNSSGTGCALTRHHHHRLCPATQRICRPALHSQIQATAHMAHRHESGCGGSIVAVAGLCQEDVARGGRLCSALWP